jgi:ABC-type antimicrobial peptide transport system permease subunit
MVIRGGLKVTALGIGIGLVGAFFLTWMLRSLLYGLGPRDPSSFLLAPVILFAVAFIASYLPARRAVRVDPISPLRQV